VPVLANSASRLLSLGLLTLLVNKQGWLGLLVFLIPLVYLFIQYPEPGRQVVLLARRLRWFFLSIIILYFWFYPGTDLFPFMGRFSPAIEGVNEAGLRITSLLIVISYSVFLLKLTPRGEIISAIQFILSPLTYLGIDSNRFALRLGLVLSIVPDMNVEKTSSSDKKRRSLSSVIDKAAVMVKQADELTNLGDINEVTVTRMQRAGALDILIPLSLLIWLLSY
jgi:energy-coupling factor transporter transmembrane protein EcfT